MTILLSDKIDLGAKTITRDNEGNQLIITKSMHQEDRENIKCVCSQYQNFKIDKAKVDRPQWRKIQNYS